MKKIKIYDDPEYGWTVEYPDGYKLPCENARVAKAEAAEAISRLEEPTSGIELQHLSINPCCDGTYPITWVAENVTVCRIDREYHDDGECMVGGVSICVQLPNASSWAEYAANDEGWMYVADRSNVDGLPEATIREGILEVEGAVNIWLLKWLKSRGESRNRAYGELMDAVRNTLELSEKNGGGEYVMHPDNFDDLRKAHGKLYRVITGI